VLDLKAEALDLLISMPSSGFSRGQGRNTTAVVGNVFYLAKPGVMRRPVESHLGACAIPPLTIAQIKVFFYKRKRKASPTVSGLACKIDVEEIRQDGGKREEGSAQALMP
jgi:hypothetical protein